MIPFNTSIQIWTSNNEKININLPHFTGTVKTFGNGNKKIIANATSQQFKTTGLKSFCQKVFCDTNFFKITPLEDSENQSVGLVNLSILNTPLNGNSYFDYRLIKIKGPFLAPPSLFNCSIQILPCQLHKSNVTYRLGKGEKVQERKRYKATLDLRNLACLNASQIVSLFDTFPFQIQLQVKSLENSFLFEIYRKQATDFNIKNAWQLAQILKTMTSRCWLHAVAEEMISLFDLSTPSVIAEIEEIAQVVEFVRPEYQKKIVFCLLKVLRENSISLQMISILSSILTKLKITAEKNKASDYREIDAIIDFTGLETCLKKDALDGDDLLDIIKEVMKKLKKMEEVTDKDRDDKIVAYLELMIVAIESMVTASTILLGQNIHDDIRLVLEQFTNGKESLKITYLASFGSQLLNFIPKKGTELEQVVHSVKQFMKGIVCITDTIDLKKTISILPKLLMALPDAKEKFKDAYTTISITPQAWFLTLFPFKLRAEIDLDCLLLLDPNPTGLMLKDPLVAMGLIHLLEKLLIGFNLDRSFAKKVIFYLEKIWEANLPENDDPLKMNFRIKSEKNEQYQEIRTSIETFLISICRTHSSYEIRTLSNSSIVLKNKNLEIKKPEECSRFFFDQVYYKKQPLEWRFRRLLKSDLTFQKELTYYQLSSGNLSTASNSQGTESAVLSFLKTPSQVSMLITASPASGKSFFVKKFALDQLEVCNPEDKDYYLPIYVPLPKMARHEILGEMMVSVLKRYNIKNKNNQISEELSERKILWIFDGYDEVHFEEITNGTLNIKSIYETNGFVNLNKSKFLFTCREGFCDNSLFKPKEGELVHFRLNQPDPKEMLERYVGIFCLEERNLTPKWKKRRYLKVLNLLTGICNPFYSNFVLLKAILLALPILRSKEEKLFDDFMKESMAMEVNSQNTADKAPKLVSSDVKEDSMEKSSSHQRVHSDGQSKIILSSQTRDRLLMHIYDIVVCATIKRAIQKNGANGREKNIVLDRLFAYCSKIAEGTIIPGKALLGKISRQKAEEIAKSIGITGKDESLFRTTFLVCENDQWCFPDISLRMYFYDLGGEGEKGRRERLLRLLTEDPYRFDEKIFYQ